MGWIVRTRLDHARRAQFRRLEISFSQGGEWKALMNRYMRTIPLSGAPGPAEHSLTIGLSSRPAGRAIIAKVGVAAMHSQLARPTAVAAMFSASWQAPCGA